MPKRDERVPDYLKDFHLALYKGVGFTGPELDRPLIGVANSWGDVNPATKYLKVLAWPVKDGVREAGGTSVEFALSGLCDGMGGSTSGANICQQHDLEGDFGRLHRSQSICRGGFHSGL